MTSKIEKVGELLKEAAETGNLQEACMSSIAFSLCAILEQMETLNQKIDSVLVSR